MDDSPPRRLLSSSPNGSAPYLESLKKFTTKISAIDTTKREIMPNNCSLSSKEYNGSYQLEEGLNLYATKELSHTRPCAAPKLNTLTNILQRRSKNQHQSNPASLFASKREEPMESKFYEYKTEASAARVVPESPESLHVIDTPRSRSNGGVLGDTTGKTVKTSQESSSSSSSSSSSDTRASSASNSLQTVFARAGKQLSSVLPISNAIEIPTKAPSHYPIDTVLNAGSTGHGVNNVQENYSEDIWNTKRATRQQFNDDNYVRRNLKKKTSSSSYHKRKNMQRQAQQSASSDHNKISTAAKDSNMHFGNAETGSHHEIEVGESASSSAIIGSAASSSSITEISGGLVAWGLDPLELSLKALQTQKSGKTVSKFPRDQPPEPSTSKWKSLHSEQEEKVVRGLTIVSGKKGARSRGKKGGHEDIMNDEMFEKHAPKCPGHQMAGKLLTVRKAGPNRVKLFSTIILIPCAL